MNGGLVKSIREYEGYSGQVRRKFNFFVCFTFTGYKTVCVVDNLLCTSPGIQPCEPKWWFMLWGWLSSVGTRKIVGQWLKAISQRVTEKNSL